MPRERAVLDSIALRKHDTVIISDSVKKNSISNLLVIGIIECADNLIFFYHSVLSAQTCRFLEETKKILGPKITQSKNGTFTSNNKASPIYFETEMSVRR